MVTMVADVAMGADGSMGADDECPMLASNEISFEVMFFDEDRVFMPCVFGIAADVLDR